RDDGNFSQVPQLSVPFVVCKDKRLVLLYWSTGGGAELMSSERGNTRVRRPNLTVKEVPCIKGAVPQKFVRRTVEGIGAGFRQHGDLPSGGVAELRRVHVGDDVEFPHRLNPQHLSADASRR